MPRRLRVLWVTPHLPVRGIAAARERWWNLLARLAGRHDVTLLAFVDPGEESIVDGLPPGLAALHRVPKEAWVPDDPLAVVPTTVRGGYSHPSLRAAIAARVAAEPFDLVQYEFIEMANLVPPGDAPAILTVHQLGFAQEGPRWRVAGARGGRAAAVALFRHLRDLDWELAAVRSAHHVITMSPEDARRLRRFLPDLRISVSPMGVDTARYVPAAKPARLEADLLFVGHFGHPPNVDAVHLLVDEVLPRIGRPVRLRVVGHGAAGAGLPAGIDVVGSVPDVRPHVAASALVVAPVRFGTGMRGKVLEALALGAPVVTTPLGAEGLGAVSGQHLLIADGADDLAAAVRRLLDDPALAARIGAAGRALVVERFDWDAIAHAHDAIYETVLRDPGPAPEPLRETGPLFRRTVGGFRRTALGAGAALVALRGLRRYLGRGRPRTERGVLGAGAPAGDRAAA